MGATGKSRKTIVSRWVQQVSQKTVMSRWGATGKSHKAMMSHCHQLAVCGYQCKTPVMTVIDLIALHQH